MPSVCEPETGQSYHPKTDQMAINIATQNDILIKQVINANKQTQYYRTYLHSALIFNRSL